MKNRKPYSHINKQYYIIKYKGEIVKQLGRFRSKYLAKQIMEKQIVNYDKKNWEVGII